MYSIFFQIPDDQLLAITAYGEAANQGSEGLMAVINVIMNRVYSQQSQFYDSEILQSTGSAIKAVVLKAQQFSLYNSDKYGAGKMASIAQNFNSELSAKPALLTAYQFAQMAMAGTLEDNTGGSTFYMNPVTAAESAKQWFYSALEYVGQIGDHVFFTNLPWSERARQVLVSAEEYIGEAGKTLAVAAKSPLTYVILFGIGAMAYIYFQRRK